MGTVGSYSGGGGKPGNDLRDSVSDWLDALPGGAAPQEGQPSLDPDSLLNVVQLLRPRSSSGGGGDGPSGGGVGGSTIGTGRRTGGGPVRSAAASATSAGRAAAGAYAFRTGDAATLGALGLNYAELSALGDPFEVARRIVDAACGPRTNSSIEDHEQRLVAAQVAEWVIGADDGDSTPTPDEIARQAIAIIIAETALVETAELSDSHEQGELTEQEIRDAAEALADRAELSVDGATDEEFARAIEKGIETLRQITGGSE